MCNVSICAACIRKVGSPAAFVSACNVLYKVLQTHINVADVMEPCWLVISINKNCYFENKICIYSDHMRYLLIFAISMLISLAVSNLAVTQDILAKLGQTGICEVYRKIIY